MADDRSYPQSSAENQSNRFLIQALTQIVIGMFSFSTGTGDTVFVDPDTYRTIDGYIQKVGGKTKACASFLDGKKGYFLIKPHVSWNDGGGIVFLSQEINDEIVTFHIESKKIIIIMGGKGIKEDCNN